MVNKTLSFLITESSVVQSVVGKSLRLVMTHWVPGEVVERLPEPITMRKRQNSIGEFLCTIHFWTI
jgi:hypothetical protein